MSASKHPVTFKLSLPLLAPASQDACACRLGGVFAWAATPNIMLLFYPVPRSTFLHWMLGQNFQQLIKYHRCRGGVDCVLVSSHALQIVGHTM